MMPVEIIARNPGEDSSTNTFRIFKDINYGGYIIGDDIIYFVLEGRITLNSNKTRKVYNAGSCFILHKGMNVTLDKHADATTCKFCSMLIFVNCDYFFDDNRFVKNYAASKDLSKRMLKTYILTPRMEKVLYQIIDYHENLCANDLYTFKVKELMNLILIEDIVLYSELQVIRSLIRIDYVQLVKDGDYNTISKIAQDANCTYQQIYYGFKKNNLVTPGRYLLKLRMERAQNLVKNTNQTYIKIACELCYIYPSNFSRAYSNYFGISPSKDRKKNCIKN